MYATASTCSAFDRGPADGDACHAVPVSSCNPPLGKRTPSRAAVEINALTLALLQGHPASPLSTQRSISKAAMVPAATPMPESPFSSSRTAYTGIRHLLTANDISVEGYPDSSSRPENGRSIDHLFSSGTGGAEPEQDAMPEGCAARCLQLPTALTMAVAGTCLYSVRSEVC